MADFRVDLFIREWGVKKNPSRSSLLLVLSVNVLIPMVKLDCVYCTMVSNNFFKIVL